MKLYPNKLEIELVSQGIKYRFYVEGVDTPVLEDEIEYANTISFPLPQTIEFDAPKSWNLESILKATVLDSHAQEQE